MNKILFFISFHLIFFTAFSQPSVNDLDLLSAAYNGNESGVIQALLHKANIEAETEKGVTALLYASQRGFTDIVKILIFNGADVHHAAKDGTTPLLAAAMFNHLDIVTYLYEKGAKPEAANQWGITALHYAAAYGYDSLAAFLLRIGFNTELKDNEGNTALMIASYTGNDSIVVRLLSAGAMPDNPDTLGFTALLSAIQNKYNSVASFLLEKNANVNAVGKNGANSVLLAVLNNNVEILPILHHHQAGLIPAEQSENPYLTALRQGNYQMIKALNKAGYRNPDNWMFTDYIFSMSLIFNQDHLMLGLHGGIKEAFHHLEVYAGFEQRLFRQRIIMEESPGLSYQYWESRSFAGLGLLKDIALNGWHEQATLVSIRSGLYYTFGNLRGTYKKAKDGFTLQAGAGFRLPVAASTTFDCFADYFFFCPADLFPLHFTFGFTSFYPLKKFKGKADIENYNKTIRWLY
ncbi:MAG TPA: ankyrin repeat domain-containing protein [Bacteroidia bacterium]|nr:ankyrin repeat domain-containing protein [Bacteroidia bacterium]HRS59587.1 ankyrin repeat domain-containing protein [Bacteroidia bacterium]HRU67624.1 ankyrin repeat domain-containing protein [Bacteroidia bacterium]